MCRFALILFPGKNISLERKTLMKAAVLHKFGETPKFEDFPDPTPAENELVIHVKAVALENVDKVMARGIHYANNQFSQLCQQLLAWMESECWRMDNSSALEV